MTSRIVRVAGSVMAAVGLAACSHNPVTVTIRGVVVHHYAGCAFNAASNLNSKTVVVRDASGQIVATAVTHAGTCSRNPRLTLLEQIEGNVTIVSAPFTVTVPKEDFYTFSVDGLSGTVHDSYAKAIGSRVTIDTGTD